MNPSQLIERYLALVEEEARFRRIQLMVLQEGSQSATAARNFIERYILREQRNTRTTAESQYTTATATTSTTEEDGVWLQSMSFELPATAFMDSNSSMPAFSSFLQRLANPERVRRRERGLTDSDISAACEDREWSQTTDADNIPMCPISLQPFNDGDAVRRIRVCGHEFSTEAITTALRTNASCPLCRADVTPENASQNETPRRWT